MPAFEMRAWRRHLRCPRVNAAWELAQTHCAEKVSTKALFNVAQCEWCNTAGVDWYIFKAHWCGLLDCSERVSQVCTKSSKRWTKRQSLDSSSGSSIIVSHCKDGHISHCQIQHSTVVRYRRISVCSTTQLCQKSYATGAANSFKPCQMGTEDRHIMPSLFMRESTDRKSVV